MADNRFINGQQLGVLGTAKGTPPFVLGVTTVAGASSYTLVENAEFPFRVIQVWGAMTGAGGGGDTVKVTDGTSDITDAVDVSALGDRDTWEAGEINDAYHRIAKGGDLKVVTASGALSLVYVMCVRV